MRSDTLATETVPWPTEIRLKKDRKHLVVSYEDREPVEFTSEFLRVNSPSAEVQGHAPHQRKTVAGKAHVEIIAVEPVGNYAVKLVFDDLHNTGIFTWAYFKELDEQRESLWARYLKELEEKGLSRS
ncbi:gamma-butyrobetaine hydroxylase-like domain-containing protein [Pseudovibrio exalbescens]|uniref:Gamma-butyrobetaine hydroxylase-like N-terminal domain-containing protein n=1 Tax=Pseudovibrio exalbescens TaxID=197461 RepID=A0A1U7JEF6_9HYPH|nr:DUF971 domain-containing protein [Pseudovibrio exalbescens]OKL43123.1 hypothetical protein A3843_15510 [Pseudovibrio exalbescens]